MNAPDHTTTGGRNRQDDVSCLSDPRHCRGRTGQPSDCPNPPISDGVRARVLVCGLPVREASHPSQHRPLPRHRALRASVPSISASTSDRADQPYKEADQTERGNSALHGSGFADISQDQSLERKVPEIEMKERDVYRWAYRAPGDDRDWGRYHCCSQIGFFLNGQLRDTYWMYGEKYQGGAGRSFPPEFFPKLTLTFVANLDDLEPAKEYQAEYYDDADIANLNHANSSSGNFYIRKGAKRSAAKMIATARAKMEQAISDAKYAVRRSGEMKEIIAKIEAGDTSVYL